MWCFSPFQWEAFWKIPFCSFAWKTHFWKIWLLLCSALILNMYYAVSLSWKRAIHLSIPFLLCITLYKKISDPGMGTTGSKRRTSKKGKEKVKMNLSPVQRPWGECPAETNCEVLTSRPVCLVPSAQHVASQNNYHRLIRSANLLSTDKLGSLRFAPMVRPGGLSDRSEQWINWEDLVCWAK